MALATNLVAYYKLDETSGNASDSTGNGYTLTNNGTTTFTTGILGNCADYGTTNSSKYFRISNNLGIVGGAITISTWVKMQAEIGSGTQTIALQGDAGTDVNYFIIYQYNAGTRRLAFNRQKQGVSDNYTYGNATLGTSSWHHIVLTYDGTNLAGYLDGIQIASNLATSGNGSVAGVSDLILGSDQGQIGTNYLSAYQDESGVWSRALSADEISQVFNSKRANAYPLTDSPSLYGGIAYYKLDESSGNASDSVGSNTGTNTSVTYSAGKINNGADFNGTTSLLNLGSGTSLDDLTEFTYSMWLKPTNFTNEMMVMGKTNRWIRLFNGANAGKFNCYLVYSTTAATSNTSNLALTSGSWNYVTISYSQSGDRKIHVYVNGTEATYSLQTASVGTITSDAANNLYISTYEGTYQPYTGSVDEVGIWNRALTSTEITSLYNAGVGIQYPWTISSGYTGAAFLFRMI